jgi:hypothetical protein
MTRFKPGDTVEVVSVKTELGLISGDLWRVESLRTNSSYVKLKGSSLWFHSDNFKLVRPDGSEGVDEAVMRTIEQLRSDGIEWDVIKRAVQNVEDNEAEESGVREAERKIDGYYSA